MNTEKEIISRSTLTVDLMNKVIQRYNRSDVGILQAHRKQAATQLVELWIPIIKYALKIVVQQAVKNAMNKLTLTLALTPSFENVELPLEDAMSYATMALCEKRF
ncbi:hypothetical protein KEM48_008230 [Puccinia striiformis f. sp. tritici PST-130]|nr:hypothetical protein KEM48_008230 [Puccinia striiformis f. sp. tritici PST-130]